MSENPLETNTLQVRKIIETAIRLALLFIVLYWCYGIVRPFVDILLWSVIFAVAQYPMYNWLQARLGGRKKLASSLVVTAFLLVLIIPGLLFAKSLYEGVAGLKSVYESAGNIIPEASDKVSTWPVVGPFIYEKWNWISHNVGDAMKEYSPQIKQAIVGLFSSIASVGGAFLKLIISIIISGCQQDGFGLIT